MINYSFIIPHRNNLELLKRCVASIPNRNDIQIIIVDDNSSPENCPQKEDFQQTVCIEYVEKNRSKGAGKARNIGLSLAVGRWVFFADCDDFYEKNFLDKLEPFKNSNYDVVFFDVYWAIDLQTGVCLRDFYKNYLNAFLDNPSCTKNRIMVKHANNCCMNKMVSLEYIKKIGASFEEVPACNDGLFVQKIGFGTENFHVLNEKLYYYVRNSNSLTTKKYSLKERIDKTKVVGRLHRYMEQNGAWCAIPSRFRGLGELLKKDGPLHTLCFLCANIVYDVPLHRCLIHYLFD